MNVNKIPYQLLLTSAKIFEKVWIEIVQMEKSLEYFVH